MKLPDFIVIGGMKCGTTSLHFYLNLHPEIEMSYEKEVFFFSNTENYLKGIEWYKQFIPQLNNKVVGETTASYAFYPVIKDVPKRIHETIPDAKLIYIIRQPVERLISQYMHNLRQGRQKEDLNKLIESGEYLPYIDYSRYYFQLEQYLEYFKIENILVIKSENLEAERKETLIKVFKFLGLEVPDMTDSQYDIKLHQSKKIKKLNKFGDIINKTPFIWRYVHQLPFTGIKLAIYNLTDTNRKKLDDIFKADIKLLNEAFNEHFYY